MATQPQPEKTQAVVRAGAPVAALVPRSLEEAWRLAQARTQSDMVPRDMKDANKVMVAIMGGAEVGLPPFQALQSFAIINGRPTLWGDGLLAVVRARGVKVKEWSEGEGDALTARCEVTRPDTDEVIPGEFSVADAKQAGLWGKAGPWTQYPKRMLKMRARAFAIRDGCSDMLRGIMVREEVLDYGAAVEVPRPAEHLRLEAATGAVDIEVVDAPAEVEVKPEANALTDVEQWAAAWRERLAAAGPDDAAKIHTDWETPKSKEERQKAHDANPALALAIKREVVATIKKLAAQHA